MLTDRKKSFEFYQETASEYDKVRYQGRAGQWSNSLQTKIISKLAKEWKDKRILEIGCGSGRCTKMLLDTGCRLIASEPSDKMLALAQKRFKTEMQRGDIQFIAADIESLVRIDAKYDVVILVNVFSRLPEGEKILGKLISLLAVKGEVVFNFQCITSVLYPFGILVNKRKRSLSRPVYSQWYTPAQMQELIGRNGAKVKSWLGHHYIPLPKRLFLLWPVLWLSQLFLSKWFPKACPSVFVVCTK
jgi:ubiquinone/menaquinone biosynthesis C-methylase UbiE